MSDIHNQREIDSLQSEIDRLRAENERLRAALEVTSSDCKEAFAENERLRAALEDIAYPNPLHNEDNLMEIARAALETREAGVSSEGK